MTSFILIMTFHPLCVYMLYGPLFAHVLFFLLDHTCRAAHPHPTNHLLCISTFTRLLQSDIKPDDLLPKGSKTKEKYKDRKGVKDKRKGQAADGAEKQPSKARVDEMVVRQLTP